MENPSIHVIEVELEKWDGLLETARNVFSGGITEREYRISYHERIIEYFGKLHEADSIFYFLFVAFTVGDRVVEVWSVDPDDLESGMVAGFVADDVSELDTTLEEVDAFDLLNEKLDASTALEEEIDDIAGWTRLFR